MRIPPQKNSNKDTALFEITFKRLGVCVGSRFANALSLNGTGGASRIFFLCKRTYSYLRRPPLHFPYHTNTIKTHNPQTTIIYVKHSKNACLNEPGRCWPALPQAHWYLVTWHEEIWRPCKRPIRYAIVSQILRRWADLLSPLSLDHSARFCHRARCRWTHGCSWRIDGQMEGYSGWYRKDVWGQRSMLVLWCVLH